MPALELHKICTAIIALHTLGIPSIKHSSIHNLICQSLTNLVDLFATNSLCCTSYLT